jgi:hypothetical protein
VRQALSILPDGFVITTGANSGLAISSVSGYGCRPGLLKVSFWKFGALRA